jgi:peptide/nickel transport system substrate-binding protein
MKHRTKRTTKPTCLWILIVAGIIAAGGIFSGGVRDAQAAPPAGTLKQAIHWGLSADWLDPATNSSLIPSQIVLYFLHDALLKPMPDGNFSPCLAESWTISPDAKVYEFKIRQGVKFHNGDPLTAEDVIFSFWRYKAGQAKIIHDRTEKVEAVNPYLVRIRFKEAFPDFLEYLLPGATTMAWIAPKKYIEKVGEAGYKKHPIGAGPYKFVEFVAGQRLVGEAFPEFWRKAPSIKRIEIHIVAEPATRLAMAGRGEADIATLMQGVFYENLKKDPKLRMLAPLSPSRWMVYFTSQFDPKSPWSDERVRKAASLAIDRQTLADIHMPGCGPIGSLGLPGDPMALEYPADPYDPEKAKKLLAEAGYPKGFHGGKFYPYEGGYWPYGEQVANYWKAIGISVDTVLYDRPAWFANRQGGKMKGGIFIDNSQAPTIGGRLLYLFGSTGYGNYPDVQELWDKYNRETSAKGRKDLIGRIQKLIHDKTMFIPLTATNSPAAFGPRVKGNPYKIQPMIWFTAPFEDMELVS